MIKFIKLDKPGKNGDMVQLTSYEDCTGILFRYPFKKRGLPVFLLQEDAPDTNLYYRCTDMHWNW